MRSRRSILFFILTLSAIALLIFDIVTGTVPLSIADVWGALTGSEAVSPTTVSIIRDIRLIKALVAILVGAALGISGLQMQITFKNPLAGPYVLGITSGASLGVALFMLGTPIIGGAITATMMNFGVAGAAWIGAACVLLLMTVLSVRTKDIMVLLILGMMLSAGVDAIVQVLQYLSHEDALKSFVVWTMGSLSDVTGPQMWLLTLSVAIGLIIGVIIIKPLNLLQLGEQYAATMGLNLKRARLLIFTSTTLLAGTITAFCGPIGFVGLAIPHITRFLYGTSDCRVLVPGTILTGINLMLACDLISKWLVLPINSITALTGIPIVIWIVIKLKKL